MCVAIFKPAGADVPSLKTLKACWESNPDGAGVAISEKRHVRIEKGFMSFSAFSKFYKSENLASFISKAMVFHFRIGTHGLKDAGNTHPFPVSDDPKVLRRLQGRYPLAVAHNGIFSNEVTIPRISDTGQFLADCHKDGGDPIHFWRKNPQAVGGSKLVVLRSANRFNLLGDWKCDTEEDGGGCFFSNLYWQGLHYEYPAYTARGAYRYPAGTFSPGQRLAQSTAQDVRSKFWSKAGGLKNTDDFDAADYTGDGAYGSWDAYCAARPADPNAKAPVTINGVPQAAPAALAAPAAPAVSAASGNRPDGTWCSPYRQLTQQEEQKLQACIDDADFGVELGGIRIKGLDELTLREQHELLRDIEDAEYDEAIAAEEAEAAELAEQEQALEQWEEEEMAKYYAEHGYDPSTDPFGDRGDGRAGAGAKQGACPEKQAVMS